jgi:glycosyltransferase involved in cell wall biosynthesis
VKRFDRFLDALAAARRRAPALTGMIVGDGPERAALEERAARLGLLPSGVRFLGARDDVPALLASSDFLVVTSSHEGFPNVVLEAYAASRPVIATPCGDVERLLREGETGFVVPFDDADALAERMVRLAESVELRRRAGAAGRSLVERSFDRAALAGHLMTAYQAIAARRGSPQLTAVLA